MLEVPKTKIYFDFSNISLNLGLGNDERENFYEKFGLDQYVIEYY